MGHEKSTDRSFTGFRSFSGWLFWMKSVKNTIFGKNGLTMYERFWCVTRGFDAVQLRNYGECGMIDYPEDFLSRKSYCRLHPVNGAYSFWIDDRLTMKYVLSKYDRYLLRYYFEIEKGQVRRLPDASVAVSDSINGILQLLREKKVLAARTIHGQAEAGTLKLEYRSGAFYMNGDSAAKEVVKSRLEALDDCIVTEYPTDHPDIRVIWPEEGNVLRVLMANCADKIVLMRAGMEFGCAGAEEKKIIAIADENKGQLLYGLKLSASGKYVRCNEHPDTGKPFETAIPNWQEIVVTAESICRDYPKLRYFELEIEVTEDSFRIININSLPKLFYAEMRRPLLRDLKTREAYRSFGLKL